MTAADRTSARIRAFVAIELPSDVRAELASLSGSLGRSNIRGVRVVRPEAIHLTLKFLGNVSPDAVDLIVGAVSKVAESHDPFVLRLGSAGAFPGRGSPRVLWVGLDGAVSALQLLQREIADALNALGFAGSDRVFRPHLTLARIRDSVPSADSHQMVRQLLSMRINSGLDLPVIGVSLMRSTLLSDGAVYDRLASCPLGGGTR